MNEMPPFPFTESVEYRCVVGFPGYCVGSDGSVWSCWQRGPRQSAVIGLTWHGLALCPHRDGHLRVTLRRGKIYHSTRANELERARQIKEANASDLLLYKYFPADEPPAPPSPLGQEGNG